MTKKQHSNQSFYIRDKKLSESQKVFQRQNLLSSLSQISPENLKNIFEIQFPIEKAGTKNCENLVGSIEVPLGVSGPVTAEVTYLGSKTEKKSFLIPLATTEGALIASIHRGLKALTESKTSVLVKKIGMSRSVVFECESSLEVHNFIDFFKTQENKFAQLCEETSSHLKYKNYETFTRGKLVFFRFVFDTDEAMGMNMVTIALSYAWEKFKQFIPSSFNIQLLTLSGNVCTDKKDSAINRLYGRGYVVIVESYFTKNQVEELLKVSVEDLVKIHTVKNLIGSNVAGSFSQNMHVANALAAFYLATGQDVAHTVAGSEASVHFEVTKNGGMYVCLTMPNVSVGSVGGGTWLPTQKEARSIICISPPKQAGAKDLATAAGLACLAGELSGLAALTTHTLAAAHEKLGRDTNLGK